MTASYFAKLHETNINAKSKPESDTVQQEKRKKNEDRMST